MKNLVLLLFIIGVISCNQSNDTEIEELTTSTSIDIEAELAGIENTRNTFMKAVKDNDMETIGKVVTADIKTVPAGSEGYMNMYKESKNAGPFPYDSIVMFPKETIIVSDSLAYDIGNSEVYYTNTEGEVVQLSNSFLAILKKGDDGVWRLHREVASANIFE